MAEGWLWVGEHALLRTFEGDLADANAAAHALATSIEQRSLSEIEDLVPGARSLLIRIHPGTEPSRHLFEALESSWIGYAPSEPETLEIPVEYGGDSGPDLSDVASGAGLSSNEVVRRHADATYTVAFIGFSPGFAYLLGLPTELATPRLETPRTRIPPGSVGIGGAYTGVYPRATPGGWRLIGVTDVDLFDPARNPPSLLSPGDRVRFVPT